MTLLASFAVGCWRGGVATTSKTGSTIETDSSLYTVRFTNPYYHVRIGFVYKNATRRTVSANYCQKPGPPVVEKDVGGRWTLAFGAITLTCATDPPFRLAAGQQYRDTFDVWAAPRGTNFFPSLSIDSIPGTYRLRWILRAGPDPENRKESWVEATSAPFELVLR